MRSTAADVQEYRAATVVLENPEHGSQLCFAVAGSYPPQCGGPDIVNWDWDAVDGEESAGGATWVDAVVTGTWDGERFTTDATGGTHDGMDSATRRAD